MNRTISVLLALVLLCSICEVGLCRYEIVTIKKVGGVSEDKGFENSAEIEDLGSFAVEEHNKRENALLVFARVLKVKEQVVAGKLYYLTLEAIDAGKKRIYEAKVWVKPWMKFRQLQEFKHVKDISSFTAADLGILLDGLGWREVPTHDPEVRDAANAAVKTIQQRSNSLLPYELLEILQAKAEVFKEFVKYDLLLKLKRGIRVEKLKVELHRNFNGNFVLKLVQDYTHDNV
ncbi:hypothetical protein Nepgr_030154 [Nepenthes gracilis]|uniref:Cysteine proteinase inhibitor n=1 Tax=Nepenthes gracilis TaxID=150966 RepID=A0AAD3TG79_NEPGR|nr:hypothetical protein Nepgr_030154 [Nepenthes gracilis]